VRPGRADRDGN